MIVTILGIATAKKVARSVIIAKKVMIVTAPNHQSIIHIYMQQQKVRRSTIFVINIKVVNNVVSTIIVLSKLTDIGDCNYDNN